MLGLMLGFSDCKNQALNLNSLNCSKVLNHLLVTGQILIIYIFQPEELARTSYKIIP